MFEVIYNSNELFKIIRVNYFRFFNQSKFNIDFLIIKNIRNVVLRMLFIYF